MRILLTAALAAAALLPLAAPAAAQKAAPKRTPAAVDPRLKAEFDASDTNKDGVLDRAEVDARVTRMAAGNARFNAAQARQLSGLWFARADTNKDGKVTPAEMQALLAATARQYDTNGDGTVSLEERAAARRAIEGEAKGR